MSVNPHKAESMGMLIVRTKSAGVFFGQLIERYGDECVMINARRLWYWSGAASLSELAMRGPARPRECKFPEPVNRIVLLGVIEIITVTVEAQAAINAVPVWSAR